MERVRYDLKRRGKGKKKGKGRGVGCRRGCGVIIPRSLHSSTPSVPSSTDTSCTLHPPTPQILQYPRTHTHTRRCDSRYASQRSPRHRGPTHSPVCQVPPTSLKQGIWLHSECSREAMGQEVRSRKNEGNFLKPKLRAQEKKTSSFITLSHSHKGPSQSSYSR